MLEKVQADAESAYANPTLLAHELLHKAAFSGGLANSVLPDPASLDGLSGELLRHYMAQTFVAGNIVVTGAGISLAQLQQVSWIRHGAPASLLHQASARLHSASRRSAERCVGVPVTDCSAQ